MNYYKHSLMIAVPQGPAPNVGYEYREVYSTLSGEDFIKQSGQLERKIDESGKPRLVIWQMYSTLPVTQAEYEAHI